MPPTATHYRVALGESDGEPTFLVQTKRGLNWGPDIDPVLRAIVEDVPPEDILDFALGSQGRFFVKWKSDDSIKRKLSYGLWDEIDLNHNVFLDRLTLGEGSDHWGVHLSGGSYSDFDDAPETFRTNFLGATRSIPSWNDVKFVAHGYSGQWAFNVNGAVRYASRNEEFKAAMRRARDLGREVTAVTFSPINWDWLIIMDDGSVDSELENVDADDLKLHLTPSQSLISKPILRMLMPNTSEYARIKKQFMNGWQHPHTTLPGLFRIYAVNVPDWLQKPYDQYRASLQRRLGVSGVNEQLRFHGTNRAWGLGTGLRGEKLCKSNQCNLCGILKTSFKVSRSGTAVGRNFMRFGYGIYTTSAPSKQRPKRSLCDAGTDRLEGRANDYTFTLSNASYKVVILANVLIGNSYSTYRNSTQLTSPPSGYDSVVGQVGIDLNYDEQVVYRDDAIRPAYIIIYDP